MLCWLLCIAGLLAAAYLINWILQPIFIYNRVRRNFSPEKIRIFKGRTQVQGSSEKMPLLISEPTCDITVVYPCYNEEERFPRAMEETLAFFSQGEWTAHKVQFVLVNDGSKDRTEDIIRGFCEKYENHERIEVLGITQPNGGKGRAVKTGSMQAKGKVIFYADADNATDIHDFKPLYDELIDMEAANPDAMVIGSRKLPGSKTNIQRTWFRKLLGLIFNTIFTNFIIGLPFRDTQCGFKFTTHCAAKKVYPVTHLGHWCWDPEMLLVARKMKVPIRELPVNWQEIEGSKVHIVRDTLRMIRDLAMIKLMYCFRLWKLTDFAP